jgi:hypothetical protein
MQDKMIVHRLNTTRGMQDFLDGKISKEKFAQNLSYEFASLPSAAHGGRAAYGGVGLNTSNPALPLTSVLSELEQTSQMPTVAEETATPGLAKVADDTLSVTGESATAIPEGVIEAGGLQDLSIGSMDTLSSRSPPGALEGVDQRMQVVGDAAIRAFEKNNPGYTVRVISGARPGATTESGQPSKHALGHAIDYEIVGPDGKALPSLGDPTHPSGMGVGSVAGDSVPKYYELMKSMEAARVKMSEKDPSYIEMGRVSPGMFFKGGAWMDSMHASFGEGGALGDLYSGFKSPDQLRAEGTDSVIIQAVERAIAAGAPVQGQGEPMKEEDMKAYAEALYSGKGLVATEIAKETTSDPKLLSSVKESANTQTQLATVSDDTKPTNPTDPFLGTSVTSMAAGGILKEPHTAVNNRTGERVNLGEVGTGGEAIVPMNKVRANDVGQQPYQMPAQAPAPDPRMPKQVDIDKKEPMPKNATGQQLQTNVSIAVDHQVVPPSARKAYADAGLEGRFNNFSSIGTQYRSFGL